MRHTKHLLTVFLAVLLLAAFAVFASANDATIVDSGYCGGEGDGTNLTWTLDSEGTLTISGVGEMPSFDSIDSYIIAKIIEPDGDPYPFRSYQNQICSVIIEDGVTSIGDYAFESCSNLTSVKIGSDVSRIGDDAFLKCFGIAVWNVDPQNPCYSSEDGVLFNKDQTELILYPCANPRTEYAIPLTVIQICDEAFAGCYNLEKLTLPGGLQEIGYQGIIYTSISDLVLPKSLKRISEVGIVNNYCLDGILEIRSMDVEFGEFALGNDSLFKNIPKDKIYPLLEQMNSYDTMPEDLKIYIDPDTVEKNSGSIYPEYVEWFDGEHLLLAATIHCHVGSTAEAYAIENGMDYELTHFYEGEWNYDWDNLVRWRKCIHCEERETEQLETETSGEVEIVAPADDDTSFEAEPVSTEYVLIKEALGDANVVKALDISLKDQDGVHVQPSGTVKVKLPGDFATGNYKVYRVNADGTYTDMNAYLQGSHLVFETDHFSLYVVVRTDAEATSPDEPAEQNTDQQISWAQILLRFLIFLFQTLTHWIG